MSTNCVGKLPWLAIGCLSAAVIAGGCSSKTPIPSDDPLIIAMSTLAPTTGTPLQGATRLQGQASKVEVFLRSTVGDPATEQIIVPSSVPVPFSVPLGLPNVAVRIAVLDIPAGYVTQVRIELDSLTAVFPDHQVQVAVPGGGLRIVPTTTLQVFAGAESDLLVPLDPRVAIASSCGPTGLTIASTALSGMVGTPLDTDPAVLSTSLNVRFSPSTTAATIRSLVSGFGHGAAINWLQPSNLANLVLAPGTLPSQAVAYFSGLTSVTEVTPDWLQVAFAQPKLTTPPNDATNYLPYYHQAVFEAHTISEGDSTPVIAILDTGANLANPDLAMNVWINEGELPAALQAKGTPGAGADFDGDGIVTFRDLNTPGHESFLAQFNITKTAGGTPSDPNIVDAYDLMAALSDKLDNDNNGYVDDLVGFNVYAGIPDPTPIPNIDTDLLSDGVSNNGQAHGRYTSGAAAAVINNGLGVPGVAPFARIMFLTVCSTGISMQADEAGCDGNAIEGAMDYAANKSVDVVNRSEGSIYSKSTGLNLAFGNTSDAGTVSSNSNEASCLGSNGAVSETPGEFTYLLNNDTALNQRAAYSKMLITQATGNCSALLSNAIRDKVFATGIGVPNVSNIVGVTSMASVDGVFLPDHTLQDFQFGNMGSDVTDLAAFGGSSGVEISTVGSTPPKYKAGAAGTSLAAPMVAGAAALMISYNPSLRGNPSAIRNILMANADKNALKDRAAGGDQPGYTGEQMVNGGNRLNVCAALVNGTCPVPYYTPPVPDAGVVDASTCDAGGQQCDAGFILSAQTCTCEIEIVIH